MKKEILTPSRCVKDVLRIISRKQRIYLILGAFVPILVALLIVSDYSKTPPVILLLGVTFILLLAGMVTVFLARGVRLRRKIRRGGCEIYEDTLTVALVEHVLNARYHVDRYTLVFASCVQYEIPSCPHYEWSDVRRMLTHQVYDTSHAGDRFYLVCLKNDPQRTPLMAYNQKFFILCEEGTTRVHTSWKDSVNVE